MYTHKAFFHPNGLFCYSADHFPDGKFINTCVRCLWLWNDLLRAAQAPSAFREIILGPTFFV